MLWYRLAHRRRKLSSPYTEDGFVPRYDIDRTDLAELVRKRQQEDLTRDEESRLVDYLVAICGVVLCLPRFVNKPTDIKQEMMSIMLTVMLQYLPRFDFTKISKRTNKPSHPFSYLYRIAYTQANNYYNIENQHQKLLDALEDDKPNYGGKVWTTNRTH